MKPKFFLVHSVCFIVAREISQARYIQLRQEQIQSRCSKTGFCRQQLNTLSIRQRNFSPEDKVVALAGC